MAVPELGLLFQIDELNIALLIDHSRPKLIFHGNQNKFLISEKSVHLHVATVQR